MRGKKENTDWEIDVVFCLHHHFVLGQYLGKFLMLKRQVPDVLLTVCTFTSQSVPRPDPTGPNCFPQQLPPCSALSPSSCHLNPFLLLSPCSQSISVGTGISSLFLLLLLLFPYLLLFSSHPLCSFSPLIAEPAVAPAAAAALALHLSCTHACLRAYTLMQTLTDIDRHIDSVCCVWVDQDVPDSLPTGSLAGLRMFFLSPSVYPSLSSVLLCIQLLSISFSPHLFVTTSFSLCLSLLARLSVSPLLFHNCGFSGIVGFASSDSSKNVRC